ncbi:KUP/HAK/KT family potassium transporter [Amycolatopsis sp. NPDC059090]|uniref:KUP/HAK/KT family potassium transporter n=1 Tax=Amycolatopsis sp. NPDC059090 TaxID=3346723 RepID=UPI0036709F95
MTVSTDNVFGVVPLAFWSMTIIVTVIYVMLAMHVGKDGEGGIMALITLLRSEASSAAAEWWRSWPPTPHSSSVTGRAPKPSLRCSRPRRTIHQRCQGGACGRQQGPARFFRVAAKDAEAFSGTHCPSPTRPSARVRDSASGTGPRNRPLGFPLMA